MAGGRVSVATARAWGQKANVEKGRMGHVERGEAR